MYHSNSGSSSFERSFLLFRLAAPSHKDIKMSELSSVSVKYLLVVLVLFGAAGKYKAGIVTLTHLVQALQCWRSTLQWDWKECFIEIYTQNYRSLLLFARAFVQTANVVISRRGPERKEKKSLPFMISLSRMFWLQTFSSLTYATDRRDDHSISNCHLCL